MNVHWRKGGGNGEREGIFSSNLLLLEYEHIFYACYNYHQERENEKKKKKNIYMLFFSFSSLSLVLRMMMLMMMMMFRTVLLLFSSSLRAFFST